MFNPNSRKYLSNKDYELIAQGDVDAIDKLHNITNAKADDERMIEEASNVYGFKNPIKRSKKRSLLNTPFTSETEGNEFRQWVNDTNPEIAKKLDLDKKGKYNNRHIKKAWKELGEDFKNDKDSTLLPEVTITGKRTKSQPAEPLLPKSIASNLNETLNVIEEEKLKLTPRPRRKEAKQNAYYKNNALDFIRSIDNYKDELYQEREKAYGGLIKTRAPQRYVGKAYQDRKHHAGFMEGDLNMYSMAKGGPLKLSPEGGPKAEEINNDYNADGMMKARFAYEEMHGNPAAKRMVSPTDNPYMFPSGERGTHYMGSYGNYAVPNIQDVNGRLEMTGPIANEEMRFETEEDARYFAKNYKNIAPAFQKAYGGPLSGSNSGKPKKDISSVGQRATDYFMSNAYLNASGDNVPYNSDMGEIIDLSLLQPEENNPMRFEPYVSQKKIKAIKN
jgi:hypothetical protein